MSRPAIGKSNISGGSKRKNYFKIQDGNNIYRILPAMFDLASSGRWSVFHRVEFGYKNSDNRVKPFLSPRVVNKDKMVEVESAAHLYRQELKEQFESIKEQIKEGLAAGTITKGEAKDVLEGQKELVKQFNLDSKHYMNVINENGEIGLLKIPNRAMQSLRPILKELEAKGIDPMSVENGRWFNFHRSGNSLDTTYNVSVVKEQVEVAGHGTLEKDKVNVLSDSILDRLSDEAFKLDQLFPAPTAEEVERIVKGGPSAVDEILSSNTQSSKPTSEQRVSQRTEAVNEDNAEDEELEAELEEQTKKQEPPKKGPTVADLKKKAEASKPAASKAPVAESSPDEEDDEEWMKQFE